MTKSVNEPLVVSLNKSSPSDLKSQAGLAASVLAKGEVIATPTDTIYGLAALASNTKAVRKIYEIKGRNSAKPIAICVAEIEDVYKWGKVTISNELLKNLLPGPVTLCFKRQDVLNPELNADTDIIGIRIPDHSFIREVCRSCDRSSALALTSANISSEKSSLAVEEFTELYSHLSAIFDGGRLGLTEQSRLGSTVVDLSVQDKYRIIRPGSAHDETVKILQSFGLTPAASLENGN